MNQKYDMIEDMENEIDQLEHRYKEAKNENEAKEKELNELEKFIGEQVEKIMFLKDNNESMVSQISANIRMERKIGVQERRIKKV